MIRKFQIDDFEEVRKLYANQLKYLITELYYNYLYFHSGSYTSFVYEEKGKIIGHHAYIPYKQKINNNWYKVATLSGAVVNPEMSGIYLPLLRETIRNSQSDVIIAFPNLNSQDFFLNLLDFSTIENNYFTINKKISGAEFVSDFQVEIDQSTFKKRFELHPTNNYKIEKVDSFQIVYKEYNEGIDLLYCNQFNNYFIEFVNNKLNEYKSINLVFHNSSKIEKLGFIQATSNKFVFKFLSDNFLTIFPCQMFNSDVF